MVSAEIQPIQRDSDVEDAETEEVHEARASRVELC